MFACTALAVLLVGSYSYATPFYVEDFDVDNTGNWTVNDPGATDKIVDFYYDYSAIGVPAAPGGTTSRGLKMTAVVNVSSSAAQRATWMCVTM